MFHAQGRVFRALSPEALTAWNNCAARPGFARWLQDGTIIATRAVSYGELPVEGRPPEQDWAGYLEHAVVPVITYPYEWSFGMLQQAALLHLELLQEALRDGCILKDATPYNIQFVGSRPVYIDVASWIPYANGEPWAAYGQFCSLFLYPLLLQSCRHLDFQIVLRGTMEGLTPEQMRRLCGWAWIFRPGIFTHVLLHAFLNVMWQHDPAVRGSSHRPRGFSAELILANVTRLTRLVHSLRWQPRASAWMSYDDTSEAVARDSRVKEELVARIAGQRHWKVVWDLGCHRGRYSRLCASSADCVLAIDQDHATIERLYQQLKQEHDSRIVPLVMNLAQPSPDWGWRGRERRRLEERARPELVVALAVIHHLVLTSQIPLADVLAWLGSLEATVILEFVDETDPQVQGLRACQSSGHHAYNLAEFRRLLPRYFHVRDEIQLPSQSRWLLVLEPTGLTHSCRATVAGSHH